MNQRIESLYYRSSEDSAIQYPSELLPIAFKELGTASEELLVALEQLAEQQEQIVESHTQLEAERRRYQSLFEQAPHPYIALDSAGAIASVNRAATRLFDCTHGLLLHKPVSILVPMEGRRAFREELKRRQQVEDNQEWQVRLYSPHREPFDAVLTLSGERDAWGNIVSICLCIRDISDRQRSQAQKRKNTEDLFCDRTRHSFSKGENIPLQPDALWLICKGWVKFSTLTENNGEVLMGIAGQGIPFCRTLTALSIYQVTALSQTVELIAISHREMPQFPHLTQLIAEGVTQRLQQSELLLSVYGRRRASDRLLTLLQVLKTILGEPVATGTRLSLRLTHQELAEASCTTRVTVTRLLSELQHQGKITIDNTNHITILE
ncbi:PAS domain-containing protein [Phormidium pseudopriestleyi FRX01]|uniref:PAS domain-containing protein n=1 Tax=Phormidium pseudopriestleyi FRX01 TaxID=1759528 RepID=A0ABS3FQ63_9CYAN|nr:PAS domain-containing protein [Phormidium pseudopriestleyi]MBO0349249.1 PAS domain-containing protein [Phormidium pseudopriestleyi FRX01]